MEQAIGIYCSTLSEIDKKISPETILKLYQQAASSLVNQSVSLPIPSERFGWAFLFDVPAFGATKRQKINDGNDWKNNKGGSEYKDVSTGIVFKRMYYVLKSDSSIRRMVVNFFELNRLMVLYYKTGNYFKLISEAQKRSYNKEKREAADLLKRRKLAPSDTADVNIPWKKNMPVRFLLLNQESIKLFFSLAHQEALSGNLATSTKEVHGYAGDLYVYSKDEVLKNSQSFRKLLYSDGGSWDYLKLSEEKVNNTLLKIKNYRDRVSADIRKIIVYYDSQESKLVLVYYFYVCCDRKFSYSDWIFHRNAKRTQISCTYDMFRLNFSSYLKSFSNPIAKTFKEFEELLKSPKKISELVELEAAFGLIYPLPGRTYFTVFDHVDGYSWTLLADDQLESIYREASANVGEKQESPGTCLLKSVKKIGSIQLYFDHIKPVFPTHSVTYFMSCLLCKGKDLRFESIDNLEKHIEVEHSTIFRVVQ